MPISLSCGCGKTLRIADEHAGKRVKCPGCAAVLTAPTTEPAFEVVEEVEVPEPSPKPKPQPKRRAEDDDDDDGYGVKGATDTPKPAKAKPEFRKRARREEEDDEEEEERPRKKKRRRSARSSAPAFDGRRIGYIVGGLLLAGGGTALAIYANDSTGRNHIKGLVFGIILALGGIGMLFQGLTGQIEDE